ncbi:hypothetical protein [Streptomyces sp. NBC_00986]|uniref:hypothetical protein n=1 Tax=Streptomyces sp. NBC_00986 TaxID=2903702 RepID=UPI00386B37F5|nr:hypothetical protein OG504_21080 [Streptomyces sp. NBC_00986]
MEINKDITRHPLIRRLIALNLKTDDYLIFGSAPLLAHGIRSNISDIDVLARGAAWDEACRLGIPATGTSTNSGAMHFWGGRIEVYREWISPGFVFEDLMKRADWIGRLPFASLPDVAAYKRKLMRPKDVDDLRAIQRNTARVSNRAVS